MNKENIFFDYTVIFLKLVLVCFVVASIVVGVSYFLPKREQRTYMVLGFPGPISPEIVLPHPMPEPTPKTGPILG